jgi:hypothetical protein
MTRDEFIKVLDGKEYSYELEGDKIIVTWGYTVDFPSIKSLPPFVEFRNGGHVWLDSLTSIPPGVEFRNEGTVKLEQLIGEWFYYWKGNIKGINPKRLLNFLISKGVFI